MVLLGLSCAPRLPAGPAPASSPPAPEAARPAGSLLPLVRTRVLEAHVHAARGDLAAAHERLSRAAGLWPGGRAALAAEAARWTASSEGREHEAAAAVFSEGSRPTIRETVLYSDDPDELRRLAAGLHRPEWFAKAPALLLLLELRVAVRDPSPDRLRRVRHAAAVLGDAPRLERIPSSAERSGHGLQCRGVAAVAPRLPSVSGPGGQDESAGSGGYPVRNSTGAPPEAAADAAAPAWAAHRTGRPEEARLLIERAYRESGLDEELLVWVRLIQGVPGEASLGVAP